MKKHKEGILQINHNKFNSLIIENICNKNIEEKNDRENELRKNTENIEHK